ncbi:MAG: response regulator [Nitrospinae bacterium]|nr:response regulator [Nitrospinota bacterium]
MESNKIFLLPGELVVSKTPHSISTILGSCVAVALFNKKQKFGGLNHYMLPRLPVGSSQNAKYGDCSIETMIKMMVGADSNKNNLQAMIIGGGHVVGHLSSGAGVAEKNIAVAFEILREHNIEIIKKDIGGNNGRKVYYQSWDNSITIRKIEKSDFTQLAEEKVSNLRARKIRVLVVDDSKLVRDLIVRALESSPNIEIVGIAEDAFMARELILEKDPDVVTLDIIMPKMDGITFLKKLMIYKPLPVIIVSTVAKEKSAQRMRADEIGAFDIIDKDELTLYSNIENAKKILIPKIEAAAKAIIRKRHIDEVKHI